MEKSTLVRAYRGASAIKERPLMIETCWTDGAVTPQPPVRGIDIVRDVLKSIGHKVGIARIVSICR